MYLRHVAAAIAVSLTAVTTSFAQAPETAGVVEVKIDPTAGHRPISPGIYGLNAFRFGGHNDFTPERIAFFKEAGVRLVRTSQGNNGTKYNWKLDLASHPDWYNNVYKQYRHEGAQSYAQHGKDIIVLDNIPVLGWVAKTDEHNFDETSVDPRPETRENLAGGGDPEKYLIRSTPQEAVDRLDHWFGKDGLGLSREQFKYWHLDNEPEGWSSTHDDVWSAERTAEECVQLFAASALELKQRHPWVRVMAPGFMSEWQWWTWNHQFVDGLPWMEYFVKRMAEESRKSGVRLLDMVNFHGYFSGPATDAELLQEHRIYYDETYEFPRANGVKKYPDGWDETRKVEMVFKRMEGWLDKYFGEDHGITLAITEGGVEGNRPPMVSALWHASMLGTFAENGVEVFTPWYFRDPQWEVMHLFSVYAGATRIESESTDPHMLSSYASTSSETGRVTVILVNRSESSARSVKLTLAGIADGEAQTLTLSDLPAERSFQSRENNALKRGSAAIRSGTLDIQVPAYGITAIVIDRK